MFIAFSTRTIRYAALLSVWLIGSVLAGQSPAKDGKVAGQEQPSSPAPLPDGNEAVQKMNVAYVKLYRTIMTPKNVADTFGRRIAKRYIAMQITIANRNKDYQWLIQDASVDLRNLVSDLQIKSRQCRPNLAILLQSLGQANANLQVSSADLTILRGVAEKGQALDPRNVALRSLTAAGVIAAGMMGVTDLGHSYSPGVAAYNGPLLSAFKELFPDYTVEQLNRLNDSAWLANTVVGKQQSKVIVIFIPQAYLLTKDQQAQYYKDPESIYSCPDLRLLEANVDGNFIATVTAGPVATTVIVETTEAAKFKDDNFIVNGTIVGNFFSDATVEMVSPPQGLTVKLDGTPTDKALKFILTGTRPLAPKTLLEFVVKGKGGDQSHVNYRVPDAPAPTLTSVSMDPATLKVGQSAMLTVQGTGFVPEGMTIVLDPSAGLTPGPIQFVSSKEIKFDLAVAASAAEGQKSLRVTSAGVLSANALQFAVSN